MRMDERVELGEGVPSRGATDDARDAAYRDGVDGVLFSFIVDWGEFAKEWRRGYMVYV